MMTEFEIISTVCLSEKSKNPIEIMCALMDLDFCNIHGCEHHTMVDAALRTAYFKATELVRKHLGVEMELPDILACKYSTRNTDCIKEDCPFCV